MSESRAAAQAKINRDTLTVTGDESTASTLKLVADEGDDAGDKWNISVADGDSSDAGALTINTEISGSSANVLNLTSDRGLFGGSTVGTENSYPIAVRPFISCRLLRNFGLGPLICTDNILATSDRVTPIGVFRNTFDLISSNINSSGALADISTADIGLLPGLASVGAATFVSATTHWVKDKIFVTSDTAITTDSATGANGTTLAQNAEFGFVFGKDLTLKAGIKITLKHESGGDKILNTGTELVSYNAGRTALVKAADFEAADGTNLIITAGTTDAVIKAGSFILGRMNGGVSAHCCLKGFINTSSGTVIFSKT